VAFDHLRKSFEDLMNRATPPDDRRELARRMRETLVQAKVGLSEMRQALEKARLRLANEERELETLRRRRELAQKINDLETVNVANRYEATHAERVDLLRKKVAVQEDEVRMAEADVETMNADLKSAMLGTGEYAPHVPPTAAPGTDDDRAPLASEIDALGRARKRAERDAEADARLEELKRRMGK
jgi:multidrug resistance efflux pump